ncbi:phage virion morphogenesis protein [Desulfosarcina sp. OttesenSCG-928-G10]|nr:phage virion morphogenesis protein [Desulfosarcina sp. OttesenSCG-928-G10]MDL2320763.1 phage virion morphogenesis protein [Desulfosarcina sp. OttesenSCG-928-B08]
MTTVRIDADIDDARALALMRRISRRVQDATPLFQELGEIVLASIQKNFDVGGRPVPWIKSKRALSQGGQTLVDNAVLKNSLNVRAGRDYAIVGTADKRARVHQFGAAKGSFGTSTVTVNSFQRTITQAFGRPLSAPRRVTVGTHTRRMKMPWGTIPARPFLMIQDEDMDEILTAMTDYLAQI